MLFRLNNPSTGSQESTTKMTIHYTGLCVFVPLIKSDDEAIISRQNDDDEKNLLHCKRLQNNCIIPGTNLLLVISKKERNQPQ